MAPAAHSCSGCSRRRRRRSPACRPQRGSRQTSSFRGGALAFGFEQRVSGAEGAFSGVAFLTREASVMALLAAPPERSVELRSAARSLWLESRVLPQARLPIAAEQAFRAGRLAGIALGSLLGGGLLMLGVAWLLARLGVARA